MSLKTGIRALTLVAAAVVLTMPAFCQGGLPAASAGSVRGSSNANKWLLSGHVVYADGTPAKLGVYIESMCGGNLRRETQTDTRGGFSFTLGEGSGDNVMNAANRPLQTTASQSMMDGSLCVLRAVQPGYESEVVSLSSHEANKPDVGTIVLRKLGESPAGTASATTQGAPKDARKAFEKGTQAAKANKPEEAAKNFQLAVTAYPKYAEAWGELAKVQVALKQVDEARKSLNMAVQADEKFIPPYLQLAALESGAQDWKAVVDVTGRMLKVSPAGYPQVYLVNATSNFRLQNMDVAEKSARAGIEIDKQNQVPKLYEVLASALQAKGDLPGAMGALKKYLEIAPGAPDAIKVRAQVAELDSRIVK